jgi:hypothetical protein
MIDIQKLKEAIDAFTLTDPEESYQVHIPSRKGKKRTYLGLSGLGEECTRKVWYDWRHAYEKQYPPQLLRLFRRGDREEYVFNFLLRGVGCEVFDVDANGKQFAVKDFEGHLSGHTDGVVKLPKQFWIDPTTAHPVLAEDKTYNKSRFEKLAACGVAVSDPKYYVQIQGYMGYLSLKGALFCAVCKDNDELHFEYVPFKRSAFNASVQKAEEIITGESPPDRIPYASPTLWDFKKKIGCKYCDAKDVCFGAPALKSCRSCKFAIPVEDAKWRCTKGNEYGEVCGDWEDITK